MNADPNAIGKPRNRGFQRARPVDVLSRDDLRRWEKIELLREWELDIREKMVAAEENMPAAEPVTVTLDEVLDAMRSLGVESEFHGVPTKLG